MLIALDHLPPSLSIPDRPEIDGKDSDGRETKLEVGELLVAVTVYAANVVRDVRENIRNLVGGRMDHYERLIQAAIEQALADLEHKAHARGYDGVIGVKISHPTVVDGGVEVIVYGNGYRFREN